MFDSVVHGHLENASDYLHHGVMRDALDRYVAVGLNMRVVVWAVIETFVFIFVAIGQVQNAQMLSFVVALECISSFIHSFISMQVTFLRNLFNTAETRSVEYTNYLIMLCVGILIMCAPLVYSLLAKHDPFGLIHAFRVSPAILLSSACSHSLISTAAPCRARLCIPPGT